MYIIDFSPPMEGISGEFNTFRLGVKWSRILKEGDKVLLVDKRESRVIGVASVTGVCTGTLEEMAHLYAHENHNQSGHSRDGSSARLIQNMIKRYGPHRCDVDKKVTVIFLDRSDYEKGFDNAETRG